jgi:hypothetical protein
MAISSKLSNPAIRDLPATLHDDEYVMTLNVPMTAGECTPMACTRPGAPLFAFFCWGPQGCCRVVAFSPPPLSSNDAGEYTPTYSYVVVVVVVVVTSISSQG